MRLLLFGGTFDPPHVGHKSILRNAIACAEPEEVWIMPAGIPPHKQASATPAGLRLEMCGCFASEFPATIISDWEMRQEGKSFTQRTVEWLKIQRPNAEIYLCIGSDMLLSFTTWHCWQELLQTVTLVVQSRTQDDIARLEVAAKELEPYGAEIIFTHAKVEEISSTWLRSAIADGKDVRDKIPAIAMEIIRKNHLYQNNQ